MRRSVVPLVLALVLPACGGGGHGDHGDPGPSAGGGTVVPMSATDTLRFEPATVNAKAGEKVTFRVTNTGKVQHEFVIGDAKYHESHREQMGSSESPGHGGHGDGGTSVDVPPGQTASVTFTMPDAAPTYACYVDRHVDAGMTGKVVYG